MKGYGVCCVVAAAVWRDVSCALKTPATFSSLSVWIVISMNGSWTCWQERVGEYLYRPPPGADVEDFSDFLDLFGQDLGVIIVGCWRRWLYIHTYIQYDYPTPSSLPPRINRPVSSSSNNNDASPPRMAILICLCCPRARSQFGGCFLIAYIPQAFTARSREEEGR